MTQTMITTRPVMIGGGASNDNVYAVFGRTADGKYHHIRLFDCGLRLRADEGLDLYSCKHATREAQEIAKRNGIPSPGFFSDLRQ